MQNIHPTARLGPGCSVGHFTVIGEHVELGAGVVVGNHVTIYAGTKVGTGCHIGDNAVIGKVPTVARTSTLTVTALPPLQLGIGCTVGTGAVVYAGTIVGNDCFIADGAQVRERCLLGTRVIIGRGATVENDTSIGDNTKLQTNAYITAKSTVEENVFIAPGVTTTNDNYIGRTEERHAKVRGPLIRKGARIGGGAILLPGVEIGQEAVVAAGATVTGNVPPFKVVMGVPARVVRDTDPKQLIYTPGEEE